MSDFKQQVEEILHHCDKEEKCGWPYCDSCDYRVDRILSAHNAELAQKYKEAFDKGMQIGIATQALEDKKVFNARLDEIAKSTHIAVVISGIEDDGSVSQAIMHIAKKCPACQAHVKAQKEGM